MILLRMCRSKEEEEAWLATRQPYVILDVGGEKFTVLRHLSCNCHEILFLSTKASCKNSFRAN